MLDAVYFDGTSAVQRPVQLDISNGTLRIIGASTSLQEPLAEVDFGEPLMNAPRRIELPDGGVCEISSSDELDLLLKSAGIRASPIVRIQKRWSWALASFIFVLVASVCIYFFGLPAISHSLAIKVPAEMAERISDSALSQMDQLLKPSQLSAERQAQIRERAISTFGKSQGISWRISFRSSRLGANAFALPNGNIVLLDSLVNRLDDEEINAVIAHELGHVVHRHGLSVLIQKSTLAIALAAWFGDVSTAATGVSGLLLQTGYSRKAEMEADAYAAGLLLQSCGSVSPLISSLEKINSPVGHSTTLFDTHPDKRQRIAAIRTIKP